MNILNRKVIANIFLAVFLTSRAADISATVLLSEGLKHEGNPVVFLLGGTWWSVALLTLMFLAVFIHVWWRLRTHEYTSPPENTGLLSKLMSSKAWSAKSQVRFDIVQAVFFTTSGFAASFAWIGGYGLEVDWLSWRSSLSVGPLPGTLMLILIFSTVISSVISFYIFRHKPLTNCFLKPSS